MNQAGPRALRMGKSILALSIAIALGWAIAKEVADSHEGVIWSAIAAHDIGTLLAIGGVFLLILKDLLLALLKTWSYIWSGPGPGPILGEASVWLIEAMIATFILGVVLDRPRAEACAESWDACIARADGLSQKCFLKCIIDNHKALAKVATLSRIASTPLLFTNARTGAQTELSEESYGVALQYGHADQLHRIVEVLRDACPRPQNATLRIVGSFSDARFRGKTPEESNTLNLKAANLRARVVEVALRKALLANKASGLDKVELHRVELPEDLKKPKDFAKVRRSAFPRVDYLALTDPQHQARSVFVEVEDPWACFRRTIL